MFDNKLGSTDVRVQGIQARGLATYAKDLLEGTAIKVVFSIPHSKYEEFMKIVANDMNSCGWCQDRWGFELSEDDTLDMHGLKKLYERLGVKNVWLSAGITNWVPWLVRKIDKLIKEMAARDAGIVGQKVYTWTVDDFNSLHDLVAMGMDGVITNQPGVCTDVIKVFPRVRLADAKDNPFLLTKTIVPQSAGCTIPTFSTTNYCYKSCNNPKAKVSWCFTDTKCPYKDLKHCSLQLPCAKAAEEASCEI